MKEVPREKGETLTRHEHTLRPAGHTKPRTHPNKGKEEHMFSVGPLGWWMRMWWGSQYFTPVYA